MGRQEVTYPVPEFVRIEYWNHVEGDWVTGHAGINLMDPQKYAQKVTDNGKAIARAVVVDTDEVIYPKGGWDLL